MTRIVLIAGIVALSVPAQAHFKLNDPASLSNQDQLGSPQKTVPCGENDGGFVLTNDVTELQTGSTITINITETIFHPGHYRVSLAQDRASLPADPVVQPGGTQCGSTAINPSPQLPLLADGLLVHTSSFSGPQTMQVQLPAGMQCTNCVLQVVQFMSNHGAPCFYHHCATVTIRDGAPPQPDAGVTPGDDAGTTPGGGVEGGGCCSANRDAGASVLFAALLGLLLFRRRR